MSCRPPPSTLDCPQTTIARFAELVFAFIDELSASSVSGHADELATTGRVRQRYLERLAQQLLAGEPADTLRDSAERRAGAAGHADRAFCLAEAQTRGLAARFGAIDTAHQRRSPRRRCIGVAGGPAGPRPGRCGTAANCSRRCKAAGHWWGRLGRGCWSSRRIDVRCGHATLTVAEDVDIIDTDDHLVELVLAADREAAEDLRGRVLAPLSGLRPTTAERLAETFRSWLLHRGQREAVAAELFIHPQTVRYRMTQIRELFGEGLNDPRTITELTVALAVPHPDGKAGRRELS